MKAQEFSEKIPFDFSGVPRWGFRLFPYFGGNKTAPHDMTIYAHENHK